jgi:hypothetical protein
MMTDLASNFVVVKVYLKQSNDVTVRQFHVLDSHVGFWFIVTNTLHALLIEDVTISPYFYDDVIVYGSWKMHGNFK